MTALYTVNYAVLGGQSNLYLQKMVENELGIEVPTASATVYKLLAFGYGRQELTKNTKLAPARVAEHE